MSRSPLARPRHRRLIVAVAVVAASSLVSWAHAARFLFDATKLQQAGNADWVVDANTNAAPAFTPTPAASGITASTPETYWNGANSAWGVTLVKHGHAVNTLTAGNTYTYGLANNPTDLTQFKVLVVNEPNRLFTASEKVALLNFVYAGGGLFMISDHANSDRDGNGVDSVDVWNNFFLNNGVDSNPFGITVNANSISGTSASIRPETPFRVGAEGTAAALAYHDGATLTIDQSYNASARGALWATATPAGNAAMLAYASYGLGRVVMMGDSSPADDGTASSNDNVFDNWDELDARIWISNASDWIAASPQSRFTAATGAWSTANAWTGPVASGTDFVAEFAPATGGTLSVTLDGNRTVGSLLFKGTAAQSISGTSTLTLSGSTSLSLVSATNASLTINTPLVITSETARFIAAQPGVPMTLVDLKPAPNTAVQKAGSGTLVLNALVAKSLVIENGTVRQTSTTTASKLGELTIQPAGAFDLGTSGLILTESSLGISGIASLVSANQLTRFGTTGVIGYGIAPASGTLLGQTYDAGDLLIRSTVPGDATLDLAVGFDDLLALAKHYNAAADWLGGDFTGDGTVSFDDLLLLAKNYQSVAPADTAALSSSFLTDFTLAQSLVPEPATLGAMALLAPFARRRRRLVSC